MTSHHPLDWIPDQIIPSFCPPLLPPPHMLRADGGLSSLQGRAHQVQQPIYQRLAPSDLECPQALGSLNSWGPKVGLQTRRQRPQVTAIPQPPPWGLQSQGPWPSPTKGTKLEEKAYGAGRGRVTNTAANRMPRVELPLR